MAENKPKPNLEKKAFEDRGLPPVKNTNPMPKVKPPKK